MSSARAPLPGDLINDLPASPPDGFARTDTISFGYFQSLGGSYYAVLGESWTWDHGSSNVYEGWYAVDLTTNTGDFFRQITTTSWAGHNNEVPAPIINGTGSVWVGLFEDEADALCWTSGLGYGNDWCQRLTSPEYSYNGSGEVQLGFSYFNDTELDFDYSRVMLAIDGTTVPLNGDGFTDVIGTPPSGPWAAYDRTVTEAEMGGPGQRPFWVIFEFFSDGGWSDEDGQYVTSYSGFGFDDLALSGEVGGAPYNYNFDTDLQGWTTGHCPGLGSFFSIQPLSQYIILDPCQCRLSGNVAAFHNGSFEHPTGQDVLAFSPPADRTDYQAYNKIIARWDQYVELPQANGVHFRPGWSYFPYLCPSTGQYMWSGRQGQATYFYTGEQGVCYRTTNIATDWGIPVDCQVIGFVYEVFNSCDAFGIPSTVCTGQSNFTPIIDNVQIRMTGVVNAPAVQFDPGDQYQDGFPMGDVLSVTGTGNANVGRQYPQWPNPNNDPFHMGDSLVVVGPTVTPSTRWDAKLWFRVKREGPGQIHVTGYRDWKNRVADGRQIVGPTGSFTWGWMDSVEVSNTQVFTNKYCSYFKENDDDYVPGPAPKPEVHDGNEIIRDGILTPGTKIQYFITGNYTCLPTTYFLYPDTTGGSFYEFEILPSYRTDLQTGHYKFPCLLYVDAFNLGAQTYIEGALNIALNNASPPEALDIPDPTTWDRYDYLNPASNFHAPMFRNPGGNNGATVAQLLGYRMIMVNTGSYPSDGGTMEYRDWQGFQNWLTTSVCGGNNQLQGLWLNGDDMPGIVSNTWPSLLNDNMGATSVCERYYEPQCPPNEPENDENYCTRLETVGATWTLPIPVDVWGNWCPQQYTYDVLGTTGTGYGLKSYRKIDGPRADFAQVINDKLGDANKYRTIIDGYSIHHMIERNGSDPQTECTFDTTRVVNASYAEISNILKWGLNISDPLTLGLCIDPCLDPLAVPQPAAGAEGAVNRLYQNSPNPFNPGTAIRFSLARSGPATLMIYDVSGRRVRTLVDGPQTAGPHLSYWDGLDDAGRKVAAGIYWSQLRTDGFDSNRKMVVLR